MTIADLTRLIIYGLALTIAGVIAVIAAINGNTAMLGLALGWIVTNVLAAVNVRHRDDPAPTGDHAA